MNEIDLINTNETANDEQNWTSKKELMEICKCGKTTIEQIINDLNSPIDRAIQNHMKKGGYHNLETYYDDYLVKLIQAKLLSNQANQGKSSDEIKELVANDEQNWYSVKEICEICNTSRQTWANFKNDSNCKIDFTVRRNLRENDKNVDYYSEIILKAFQVWLLSNQVNQGKSSDEIKELVANAVKNELTKTLTKEEIRIELARNKTLQLQSKAQIESSKAQIENSKAQKEIVKQTEMTKREEMRLQKEQARAEILKQKNYDRAIKLKEKGYKEKVEELTSQLENQAIQYEYTKKLKALDAECKYMLYIFKDSTKPACYKIGKSTSLGNRLAIGYAENCTLEIIYKRYDTCEYNINELEKQIHSELKKYRASLYIETGTTEWFFLTKEQLEYIVKKYNFIEV